MFNYNCYIDNTTIIIVYLSQYSVCKFRKINVKKEKRSIPKNINLFPKKIKTLQIWDAAQKLG